MNYNKSNLIDKIMIGVLGTISIIGFIWLFLIPYICYLGGF